MLQAAGSKTSGVEGELGAIERFGEFMGALDHARELRNGLLHALPALNGLQRRGSKVIVVEGGVWTFYTPERVDDVTEAISLASRLGNRVLYANDGNRVEAWRAQHGLPTRALLTYPPPPSAPTPTWVGTLPDDRALQRRAAVRGLALPRPRWRRASGA